ARHSSAHNVRVCLSREQGHTRLVIQDDGQGFDPAATSGKGLGLRSMRERIEAQGGTLEITSKPGEGTRIEVRIGN
ncbi:MAG TPA: ATP-binding protein, partial [Clostridia bacterium]|nr:ATP-binding protein [Clostridia bacterium]